MKALFYFITGFIFAFYLFNTRNNDSKLLQNKIKTLVRQASRWSTAAKQDENSMIAVLHANYGAGYLWAIKDIASTEHIKDGTGIDILKFEREVVNTQDAATKKMAKLCPKFAPNKTYLTEIAGEG